MSKSEVRMTSPQPARCQRYELTVLFPNKNPRGKKKKEMNRVLIFVVLFGLGLTAACNDTATVTNTNGSANANRATNVNSANTNANTTASPANTNVNTNANTSANANVAKKEGGHEHTAPHGGTLVVFGEEFAHLELVLDKATGKLTAYSLDGEAEKGVEMSQSEIEVKINKPSAFTVKLAPVESTLSGSKKGAATQFEGTAEQLKNLNDFDAALTSVTIKGKEFKNVAFNFPKGNEH
jgi:hypothetical protein